MKKAQKGNDKAFLTIFQEYEQDLYRIAFIYVKNQNDALDVVQETAFRSFKTIKKLKEPKYFKTWLIRIAINSSIDFLKKKRKDFQLIDNIEEHVSKEVNEDIELEITVKHLMDYLDEMEKSVIILRFYEDLTLKVVAETPDIPLGTAKTILYRALTKLRNQMEGGVELAE